MRTKYPALHVSRKAVWHLFCIQLHLPLVASSPSQEQLHFFYHVVKGSICGPLLKQWWWKRLNSSVSMINSQHNHDYRLSYLPHLWKSRSLWLPQLSHGQETPIIGKYWLFPYLLHILPHFLTLSRKKFALLYLLTCKSWKSKVESRSLSFLTPQMMTAPMGWLRHLGQHHQLALLAANSRNT